VQQQSITTAFGTIVTGLSIARLAPPDFRRLHELWQQRHVLVLRGQAADGAGFEDFVAGFGEAEPMPPPSAAHTGWDAELSWVERPPFACALRACGPAVAGSASWFACLPAALKLMAPDLAARLPWLALQHGPNVHPLVIVQPESGEPTLYLGARGRARIPGVPPAESERLLNILWSYATSPSVTLFHAWQPGDIVLWNNLTAAHRHELAGSVDGFRGLRVKGRYTLSAPIQQEAEAAGGEDPAGGGQFTPPAGARSTAAKAGRW
jgi:taurine dioxygenase